MKKRILKFLVRTRIIKNGYLNPLIMWGFLLLCPIVMYVAKHNEEEQKYYVGDQELISLILKEYENNMENDLILNDEPVSNDARIGEIKLIKKESKIEKTDQNTDNLFVLMTKAKRNKSLLSEWDHFRLKVYQTALNLKKRYPNIGGTPEQIYDWSMKTFYQESKYNKDAQNPHSSAYGLFQAMANTRKSLNMPKGLRLIEQVPYYEKYVCGQIDNQRLDVSKIGSPLDWYLIVFYPNLSDKNDSTVFAKCGGYEKKRCVKRGGWKRCNYHANVLYDLNKDGVIYKSEIGQHLLQKYSK